MMNTQDVLDGLRRVARAADWGVSDVEGSPDALNILCILESERTQNVTCAARVEGQRRLLELSSPAGSIDPTARNLSRLVRHQARAVRARYDLDEECAVTARAVLDLSELVPEAREPVLDATLREVARLADTLEEELTGVDEL